MHGASNAKAGIGRVLLIVRGGVEDKQVIANLFYLKLACKNKCTQSNHTQLIVHSTSIGDNDDKIILTSNCSSFRSNIRHNNPNNTKYLWLHMSKKW